MSRLRLVAALAAAAAVTGAVPGASAHPAHDVAPGLLSLPVFEVPDLDRATSFWEATLGLRPTEVRTPDATTTQRVLRTSEPSLDGLVVQRDRNVPAPAGGCVSMTGTCGVGGHGRYNRLQVEINPVSDVVPTALRFQQAGGQLLAVLNSASGYTVAFATDPWGNTVELYNYQPQRGEQPVRIANVDLYVTDLERGAEFYTRTFGLHLYPNDRLGSNGATVEQLTGASPTDTSDSERVLSFAPDHMEGVVVMAADAALGKDPSYRSSLLTVEDVRSTVRRAVTSGGRVLAPVRRDRTGRLTARLADPDGNVLDLRQGSDAERRR